MMKSSDATSQVSRPALVISCEHGGNEIPAEFKHLFAGAEEILTTHRGFDPGALELSNRLSAHFKAPLVSETRSRLLIEMNRSLNSPTLFSIFTRSLAEPVKQQLIESIYHPYRNQVRTLIKQALRPRKQRVVHLSVHSFTPVLDGHVRRTDLGLLFDPSRSFELHFCQCWRKALKREAPELKVHFNLPYRGTSDGLTTSLRPEFSPERYAGFELEVNQKFPQGDKKTWNWLQHVIQSTFATALEEV